MIRQRLLGLRTAIKKPLALWLVSLLIAAMIGGGTEAAVTHTLYGNLVGNVTGNVTSGSSSYTATSATVNGNLSLLPTSSQLNMGGAAIVLTDGTNSILKAQTAGGCDYLQSTTVNLAHICNADNLILDQNGALNTGTSSYGATSATVNGPITANGAVTINGAAYNVVLQQPSAATSGTPHIYPGQFELDAQDWNGSASILNKWTMCIECAGEGNDQLDLNFGGTVQASVSKTGVITDNGSIINNGTNQVQGVGSCTGAPSILYGTCFGSNNGTTNIVAFVVGKQSGNFGGTTSSNSALGCWFANNGTTDVGTSIYVDSSKTLQIGSTAQNCGAGTTISAVRLGANTTVSGTVQASANSGGATYIPPVYTTTGSSTGATMHMVFGQLSATLNSCTTGSVCTFSAGQTVTFSGAGAFTSSSTFTCSASNTGGTGNIYSMLEPSSGTSAVFYVLNDSGATVSGSIPLSFSCLGT